jgi:hypothetical protein
MEIDEESDDNDDNDEDYNQEEKIENPIQPQCKYTSALTGISIVFFFFLCLLFVMCKSIQLSSLKNYCRRITVFIIIIIFFFFFQRIMTLLRT